MKQGLVPLGIVVGIVTMLSLPLAAGKEPPDLGGTWTLNERLSEDPREKMREARGGPSGGGMGGGRGRGGGMGGGMGGGREMPEGMDPEAMKRRMQEAARASRTLMIAHEEPRLTIRFADGRERTLYTDGRKQTRESDFGDLETRAKWKKDGRLKVEATNEQGRKINEIYRCSSGEGRLYVTITMKGDGRMPDVTFDRVYDRAPDGAPDEALDEPPEN
jgi:hypothetical protein